LGITVIARAHHQFSNPIEKLPPNSDLSAKICQLAHYLCGMRNTAASFVNRRQTSWLINSCAYAPSFTLRSAATYTGIGRPRVHGDKFKLNDPTTWWTPNHLLEVHDPKLGRLCLRLWENLHFQQSALHPMHLIQVEHLDEFGEIQTFMAHLV